ncbi:MAG TPA: DUF2203 domain-containing protein [Anaerolineales bacterium]
MFTLDQANELLPTLRPLVDSLIATRDQIVTIRPELDSGVQKALGNGASKATGELLKLFRRIERLIKEVHSYGVLLKDVDQGLLDFPAEKDGRVVFLCWKHGEASIGHWHDLDSGFAGRQPL